MVAYPWGGHSNGLILPRELTQLRGEPGDLMRSDAARQFDALTVEFRKYFGKGLVVREAYRSLAEQRRLRDGWLRRLPGFNPAAVPGTSVHGWGLAVDLASGVNRFGSAEHNWMLIVAQRYGFDNWRGRADGEAWHWEFGNIRPSIEVADNDITPIDNTDSTEPQIIKKRRSEMFIHKTTDKTDHFFTSLGDTPIRSAADYGLIERYLADKDEFNRAEKDIINGYIYRAGKQLRDAIVASVAATIGKPSPAAVDEAAIALAVWRFPVNRGDKPVAAIQELADAKSLSLKVAAANAALQATVDALTLGTGIDPQMIRDAAQAGAASALVGLTGNVSIELDTPKQ